MAQDRRFPWFVCLAVLAALAAGLWISVQVLTGYRLFHDVHPGLGYGYAVVASVLGLGLALLTGKLLWGLILNQRRKSLAAGQARKRPSQMGEEEIRAEITSLLAGSRDLSQDPQLAEEVRQNLADAAANLAQKLAVGRLEIVAFGTVSSGKSSLLNCLANREAFHTDVKGGTTVERNEVALPGDSRIILVDTPGLGEVHDTIHAELAQQCARDADLVLFVVDGPLKEFEHRLLTPLAELEKQVVVCLNKEDWYAPREQELLMQQLKEQITRHLPDAAFVAVRSKATVRKRIRVLTDGSEREESVEVQPDISELAQQLNRIVKQDGKDLLLANMLLRSRALVSDAKQEYQVALDKSAWEVIDTYTWQAGAAAAISPVPLLDVAAAAALDVKMVMDLARVYKQDLDLETARRLLGELGKNLITTLGMSTAGPMMGTAIASLLKSTVPGLGTLTGGLLQGLVQALITRWIGRIFREYFRNGMQEPTDGWLAMARRKWAEVTEAAELVSFVRTGLGKLGGKRS